MQGSCTFTRGLDDAVNTTEKLGEVCFHGYVHMVQQHVLAAMHPLVTVSALSAFVPRMLAERFVHCAITAFAAAQCIHRLHF